MEMKGKKKWIIPGVHIPFKSTGREPDMLSQDRIAVLNLNPDNVKIHITVYQTGDDPVSGYNLEVKGRRLRKIRLNDLIDPFPLYLETDYALLVEADREVIVQFLRMNTGHGNAAIMGTMGYGTDK
jgi:hypothetical protein